MSGKGILPLKSIFFVLLTATICLSQVRWQTTHNGSSMGNCQLQSSKIVVNVNPFHLDVEEEAVISTLGTVFSGDSSTLEIFGEFQLSSGTALRSALLWNGDKILKAKLLDKRAADSAYEAVVDRDAIRPIVRDPVIIEWIGGSRYRFKIYPVAINESRKLRILYSIPLKALSEGPRFQIQTAFTTGYQTAPTSIPVIFRNSSSAFDSYIFQYGNIKKTVQFDATYMIPYETFQQYYSWSSLSNPLFLYPDSPDWNHAYYYNLESGDAQGHYTAIFSSFPDTLNIMASQLDGPLTMETTVKMGDNTYIADLLSQGCFGVYLKSQTPWDKNIYWTIYGSEGDKLKEYTQKLDVDTSSTVNKILPLIWGAKYSLEEGKESLGATFGFVDQDMSLLALESDTLKQSVAKQFKDEGVPPLLPEEIIVSSSYSPIFPEEYVIYEFENTPVIMELKDLARLLQVQILADGQIMLTLGDFNAGEIKAMLFDLRGRLIHNWGNLELTGNIARLRSPAGLRGAYILRVITNKGPVNKRIVFK